MRASLVVLAIGLQGCGGGSGSSAGNSAPPTSVGTRSTLLLPAASVRLSGAASSGLAEAGGWLWVTHFEAGVMSQVDPRSSVEIGVVEVGPNAGSVTAIGAQLWIAHYTNRVDDSRLSRVDPLTATAAGGFRPPRLCCEVAGAAGRVWAVDPRGALLEIDPDRERVVSSTPMAFDPTVHIGLMGDERALWLASDTTPLLRIDPARPRVVATLDVGGGIPMAIAQGLVWGASPTRVWAVDPASNEVRFRLRLENTIETLSLAVTADAVWVGARRPGHVGVLLRVDLASGRLTGEAPVGLPARVLHAFGRIWVVDWNAGRLLRFD